MGWPRGRPRGPRKTIPPEVMVTTEEAIAASAAVNEKFEEVVAQMAPKVAPKKTGSKPKWTMKAGGNWEDGDLQFAGDMPDELHIPRDMIPEGMTLQWCTESVWGQELPQRMAAFARAGWTPVHPSDFDARFDGRWTPRGSDEYIRKGGLVLCARPAYISEKARKRQELEARQSLALKEQAFMGGEMNASGADHPTARKFNHITRTVERIDIPKD